MSFANIYAQHKDDIIMNPPAPKPLSSPVEAPTARNLNPTGLWSDAGNYTANWSGLTGNWATDQPLYDSTSDFFITSSEDLAALTVLINTNINYTFSEKFIYLTTDIDLASHYWDMAGGKRNGPTNNFSGRFEGGDFTIRNMMIDYSAYDPLHMFVNSAFAGFGLFAYLYGAKIRNVILEDPVIVIGDFSPFIPVGVGLVAGMASNALLDEITIINGTIGQADNFGQGCISMYFGGLVGASYNPFVRNVPQNLPNAYTDCVINGLSISYSKIIDQNWRYILAFGGIVGGDFPDGVAETEVFQSRIDDCIVNGFTVTRGPGLLVSFMYECYGGLMGLWLFPCLMKRNQVSDLIIDLTNAPVVNGLTFGEIGPATVMAGGCIGYGTEDPAFTQGIYNFESCSAQGLITATANETLLPVYIGGAFGMNDAPAVSLVSNYTNFDFTALLTNKNDKLIYGNLCGALFSPRIVTRNIFNNWDLFALTPQPNGYTGKILTTFALTGVLENDLNADLSANWGITKNVLLVNVKERPLNYPQCDEALFAADFYDNFSVLSYTAPNMIQDADLDQVTFTQGSGLGYWPMDGVIQSNLGSPTWNFTQDMKVIQDGFVIFATADAGGLITPIGIVTAQANETVEFQILPNPGYRILAVLVDGVSVGAVTEYTFVNVTKDHSIHALFESLVDGNFTNQATLSYGSKVISSNTVTGTYLRALTATKSAMNDDYGSHDRITYLLSLINSSLNPLTSLIVRDNLGAYPFRAGLLFPLTYLSGTVQYYVDGVLQPTPTITEGPPLTISGITVPPNGNAMLLYEVMVNQFAPLQQNATIENQVTVQGGGLSAPAFASNTISAADSLSLTISKNVCPSEVSDHGEVTYTFLLQNSGNTAALAADNVIITDTFDPILHNLSVRLNGTTWQNPTNYQYDLATGQFQTLPGQITVPAASYTQDITSGTWTTHPGVSILTVTGRL